MAALKRRREAVIHATPRVEGVMSGASAGRFEGYTMDELVALPREDWDALLSSGEPMVFRVGEAVVLGRLRMREARLVVELAHIDGGGDGVLVALWRLADRLALRWELSEIEWLVHAATCARPNLRLRALLVARGFGLVDHPEIGAVYWLCRPVAGGVGH